jgi:hypothetical protein
MARLHQEGSVRSIRALRILGGTPVALDAAGQITFKHDANLDDFQRARELLGRGITGTQIGAAALAMMGVAVVAAAVAAWPASGPSSSHG